MIVCNEDGWVSIDIIMAFLIILLITPSIIVIIEERINTTNHTQEITEAKILTENIAERIEKVYCGGNGCSILYKTPLKIGDKSYRIHVNSSGVFIKFSEKMGSAYICPIKVSNDPRFGFYVLMEANKTYNISHIKNEFNQDIILIKEI